MANQNLILSYLKEHFTQLSRKYHASLEEILSIMVPVALKNINMNMCTKEKNPCLHLISRISVAIAAVEMMNKYYQPKGPTGKCRTVPS